MIGFWGLDSGGPEYYISGPKDTLVQRALLLVNSFLATYPRILYRTSLRTPGEYVNRWLEPNQLNYSYLYALLVL